MLAALGLTTIVALLLLILTNRMSPLVALISVPVVASLVAGFGLQTTDFVLKGVKDIAPFAAMFMFAILYFGIMTDAGMFDPIVHRVLKAVGTSPSRITVGTAVLTALTMLDGSGATTFLTTVPIMLPLYKRLGMDIRVLACVVSLAAGVMNMLPWGGPTIRAAAALKVPVAEIFMPLLPVLGVGLIYVGGVAFWLGRREEKRLKFDGAALAPIETTAHLPSLDERQKFLRRPKLVVLNAAITLILLTALISGYAHPAVAFMLGTAIALLINYPTVQNQKAVIEAHSKTALLMASILFAAGSFTGILNETGMLSAMSQAAVTLFPQNAVAHLPFTLGILSMPMSLVFDPDSFYFGVLPVLTSIGVESQVPATQIAQSALLGQMTTGFPVSPLTPATFLLVGLSGIELWQHQRFTIPYLFFASVVMTIACVVFGVFPL